jgi:hypothetical protein
MFNLPLKDPGNELDLVLTLMGSRLNLYMDPGLLAFKLMLLIKKIKENFEGFIKQRKVSLKLIYILY